MVSRSVRHNFLRKFSMRSVLYTLMATSPAVLLFMLYASSVDLGLLLNWGSPMSLTSVNRQEERQYILQTACDATKTLRSNESLERLLKEKEPLKKIIVNDRYKLLYCYIPKVSSTLWKKVMGVLAGKLPNVPLLKIRGDIPHKRGVHQFLSELPAAEIRSRLENYTSFLFVRHPLERLVSGYRNKFVDADLDSYFPRRFAAKIKARYGSRNTTHGSPASERQSEGRVTFEEFARWVSDPHPNDGARNEHWVPMAELCHPCSVPYKAVGKMESLVEDAQHVLRTANVDTIVFPEGFHSKTRGMASELLASLPKDVLRRVLRLYFEDFLLFGYDPSEVFVRNRTAEISTKLMFESMLLTSE